jgi:hypothetical protein
LDTLLVCRWRDGLMGLWVRGEADLGTLADTLTLLPGLPGRTLEGLLDSLPRFAVPNLPAPMREALAQTQQAVGRLQTLRTCP